MLPQSKLALAISPVSLTAGATATKVLVDTKGFKFASFDIVLGAADVVSNVPQTLKLQEADVTNSSSLADISAFKAGDGFTLNTTAGTNTATPNLYKLDVNLLAGPRKRYLALELSPRTTQVVSAVCNLFRAEQTPVSAAETGVLQVVRG